MRILVVTPFFAAHGGGIELVAAQLATRMAASGHTVTWCASDSDEAPLLPGVSCVAMPAWNGIERVTGLPYPLWSLAALRRLARLVRSADAVHVHDGIYAGSLAAAWCATRCRKPLVVTQHVGPLPLAQPLRALLALANRVAARSVLRRAVAVAFVSPLVRQYFVGLGVPPTRCHDVPNGVDSGLFHAAPGKHAASWQDAPQPNLLFVGRFVAKKRLPLLRAMALLRPAWHWCLVGHGPERPQDWQLPNVQVLPPMPQAALAAHYRAADLLVLPSAGEGFPLVVQEAMACGLPPCITAEVAAGGRLPAALFIELPDRRDGDEDAVARRSVDAIARWLALPAAQRTGLRAACAQHAAAAWSWDASTAAHLRWLSGGSAT